MKTFKPLVRAILIVAVLNLAYFCVELAVALRIESASLLADAVDFLEDAAVNLLIVLGLGWSATHRARLGRLLALILLAPAVAFLWTLWGKVSAPVAPAADLLTMTGLGALAVNLFCAFLLARCGREAPSLRRLAPGSRDPSSRWRFPAAAAARGLGLRPRRTSDRLPPTFGRVDNAG